MALNRQLARLAKLLVDSEGIDFPTAQARLKALTLEVVVGDDATSAAAHAAVLTAVSVGRRSFVGGVRVTGAIGQRLNTALPLKATTLADGVLEVGASTFEGPVVGRIVIGTVGAAADDADIAAWCDEWLAGIGRHGDVTWGDGSNPLTGIAVGALAVGAAFEAARRKPLDLPAELDLWPRPNPPAFSEVFLPGALWLIGLGNLGQAFLWALSSLPYTKPEDVELVLVDRDRVSEENWATSVLVREETYGALKTKVGEGLCDAKGFRTRRVDRRLLAGDRLEDADPRVALCGVDSVGARRQMAEIGFECILDVGLGRKASDFDLYRVTAFDARHRIDDHFAGMEQKEKAASDAEDGAVPDVAAYKELEAEIGRCGAAEIAGAGVAAPYASAVAAAVAVARLISLFSGCDVPRFEVGRVRAIGSRRLTDGEPVRLRASLHAGRPGTS